MDSKGQLTIETHLLCSKRPSTSAISITCAKVAELVDALDLGSSTERCESSSLSFRTINSFSMFKIISRCAGHAGEMTSVKRLWKLQLRAFRILSAR